MTDNELAREIRDGNQLAFTMTYDKYHKQLYAFAYRYARNGALAEDIVQYTFLKLWETRSKLLPASGLAGYLFRIAKNRTLNACAITYLHSPNTGKQQLPQANSCPTWSATT